MDYGTATPASRVDRFWDSFIKHLSKQGVNKSEWRWYVFRAEQYIKSFSDKRLANHSAEDTTRYLESLGRKGDLEDWQFFQAVRAIRNLLGMVKAPAHSEVDWTFWRDSARRLTANHPTIARESADSGDMPVSGRRFKVKTNSASFLDSVREKHAPLLERLISEIRRRNYSIRTEQAYEGWVCRFIAFFGHRDPRELGEKQIVAFLEDLAVRGNVAASTQSQALNALVFLYKQVLERHLEGLDNFTRAKRPKRLPVVLNRGEIARLLGHLDGTQYLMAALLYGTGMRLMECIRLRVQDLDFEYKQIVIRNGKGQKDRVVPLPKRLVPALRDQLGHTESLHQKDLEMGYGEVYLQNALARKWPNAPKEWIWQYVFPSGRLSVDPRSGKTRRHHIHESSLQKGVKAAAQAAGVAKKVNCHSLPFRLQRIFSSEARIFGRYRNNLGIKMFARLRFILMYSIEAGPQCAAP